MAIETRTARPLSGKTILVTRPAEQADALVQEIERRGGRALVRPLISIGEPESWEECDRAIERLPSYDGVVFTSMNAVRYFVGRCQAHAGALRQLCALEVFAVGTATRALLETRGVPVAHVPDRYSSEQLTRYFGVERTTGKRFLMPRGNIAREELAEHLVRLGAHVDTIVVYRTASVGHEIAEEVWQSLIRGEVDVVTFASPSAVSSLAVSLGNGRARRLGELARIAVIGPTTALEAEMCGIPVHIAAGEATAEGLVEAIANHYS